MNPSQRRSRLMFLARAMRDEASRVSGDRQAAMVHDSVVLSYMYRAYPRLEPATVDAFTEAAIDTIVAAASSRINWRVATHG